MATNPIEELESTGSDTLERVALDEDETPNRIDSTRIESGPAGGA